MATISKNPNGTWRLVFVDRSEGDSVRRKITIPRCNADTAALMKSRISKLIATKRTGVELDHKTLEWLSDVGDELYGRLERVGLVGPRQIEIKHDLTVGQLLTMWEEANSNLKPNTVRNNAQTADKLRRHLGEHVRIDMITSGTAKRYVANLSKTKTAIGKLPSPATVSREIKRARQVFAFACDHKLISENPFVGIKAGSQANRERIVEVSRDVAEKVLDACPDNEWRLIFALCRFGGLRCPSEVLELKWGDILWQQNRIRVPSPKTEHIAGGGSRLIPIFPELRPFLDRAFEEAKDGAIHVVARYRGANANLRTQLLRIIDRAGVDRWPRVFQNLRASRETELMESNPAPAVYAWIGNTEAVATKHYLKVRDADFDRAAGVEPKVKEETTAASEEPEPEPETDSKAVARNVAQQAAALGGTEWSETQKPRETREFPEAYATQSTPTGMRTRAVSPELQRFSAERGTKRGTLSPSPALDVEHRIAWALTQIAAAPGLSQEQRDAIAQATIANMIAAEPAGA